MCGEIAESEVNCGKWGRLGLGVNSGFGLAWVWCFGVLSSLVSLLFLCEVEAV